MFDLMILSMERDLSKSLNILFRNKNFVASSFLQIESYPA